MNDPRIEIQEGTAVADRCADVIILGAGAAGLTAASELSNTGLTVIVIDKRSRCGGMHRSCNIGNFTFDSGSIFFEDTHPFFEMFESIKPLYLQVLRRQGRVTPAGKVLHYPFELGEVLTWPLGKLTRISFELLYQRLARRLSRRAPEDAEAFSIHRIGRTAYEASGLKYYISRFHRHDPKRIDIMFAGQRMRFVQNETRFRSVVMAITRQLLGKTARTKIRKELLVRPREGFDSVYDEVRFQLEARGVQFLMNAPFEEMERQDGIFKVMTPIGPVSAPNVVSAIPLETLHHAVFGCEAELESLDLLTLFISVSNIPGFDGNVLFNFHERGCWKRATIYSRIYGQVDGREYFAVEVTQRKHARQEPTVVFEEFRRDVADLSLFADDLEMLGWDVIEDAYPLYHKGCRQTLDQAVKRVMDFGIVPVGRQGRFAYLPVSAGVVAKTRAELEGFEFKRQVNTSLSNS
ncbi:MAG: hypothetical protein CML66_29030 [Rhodobacteraceae bacterium]|nr:hypothetical protein [Paracoccaceae bacterium]MAY45214.1 hypothetical protein [Paracoccaceae bacterium]|tara:strand:- start:850 stop:2241 length:1392 start_codon:yes stop_codon:yes gene_type:complete